MPVREIPIGTRAVTGRHARSGARYESSLERDFYELISSDSEVASIDWQPVKITYRCAQGKVRRYTPDALIVYKKNPVTGLAPMPLLVEVKYREDYRLNFHEFKERFCAARKYAREHGWRFKVVTEREIRTVRFSNIRFLSGFKDRRANENYVKVIKQILISEHGTTFNKLLYDVAGEDRWKQAEVTPTVWYLIANGQIVTDLTIPISTSSILAIPT
ncbi:MAG: TnsA endonuclease N-terminal domain-containing protein [Pseudomonadota bacterium]